MVKVGWDFVFLTVGDLYSCKRLLSLPLCGVCLRALGSLPLYLNFCVPHKESQDWLAHASFFAV